MLGQITPLVAGLEPLHQMVVLEVYATKLQKDVYRIRYNNLKAINTDP